jgi:hypothetical protein
MGAANQNTTQLHAQSSYMSYAGQYGNAKELAGSVQKNPAECATWQCLCAWRHNQTAFLKATVPGQFSQYALGNTENAYRKFLEAFAQNTSTSVGKLGLSSECQPSEEQEDAPMRPEECKTVSQLKAWRKKQLDNLDKFVPAAFRQNAGQATEKDYQTNLARLEGKTQTVSSAAPAELAAPAPEAPEEKPKRRWPFLALAEQPPAADDVVTELAEPQMTEASEPEFPADVAPEPRAEQEIYTDASGPSGGRLTLCVLAGFSLPALLGLAGALTSRRRSTGSTPLLAVEQDGLYEALVA